MASTLFHPANTRIHADLGWLNAYRSFNPGNAPESSRDSFGALLILNDDTVAPGRGFGMHPHQNMEIITVLLDGAVDNRGCWCTEIISPSKSRASRIWTRLFDAS